MANRKLTLEQQNWLFLHYAEMTNKELASHLTVWIRNDNEKQLERLQMLFKEDFSKGARKVIEKKIEAIGKFKDVSESLVKRYARILHCRPKSREHIISCNQAKAKATNIKRWLDKAEKVEHVMDWLRTFEEKDIRFCIMQDRAQYKSFLASISKFNRYEGYDKGVYLTSQYLSDANLLRVQATLYRALE